MIPNTCKTKSVSNPSSTPQTNINPGLSIAIINCQSNPAKKASFTSFSYDHSPDIIVGSESWLTPSIPSSEIFPDGYTVYRKGGYGGVFIACESKLVINFKHSAEIVVCHIKQKGMQPLIICSIYRPPQNDYSCMEALCDTLTSVINTHPNSPIWIAGDINLPNINWERLL